MPDIEQKERDDELRSMVLSVALGLCASVVEKAQAAGLAQAHLVEEVPAAGATWSMRAVYFSETLVVQVTGQIVSGPEENTEIEGTQIGPVLVFTHEQIMRLFGGQQGAQFQYIVPVPWIVAAQANVAPA